MGAADTRFAWSPQEDQQLIDFVKAGRFPEWISGKICRSTSAIYRRILKLGLRPVESRIHPFWNDERDRILRDRVANNVSRVNIGREFGLTEWVIRNRCIQLGIEFRPSKFARGHNRTRHREIDEGRDPATERAIVIGQDQAFQIAMLSAVLMGQERCPVSIDKTPGTERPKPVMVAHTWRSGCGSSAALTAEWGAR